MSATPPQVGARPPKQLSSRLMTMKFMQRAAASPLSSPSTPPSAKRLKTSHPATPTSDGPSGPATPLQISSKTSSKTLGYPEGPSNPSRTPVFPSASTDEGGAQLLDADLRVAMKQAVADEERRREAALAKNETASAETRWVLSAADVDGGGGDEENGGRGRGGLRVVRWGDREDGGDEGDLSEEQAPWRSEEGWGGGMGRMKFGAWKVKERFDTRNGDNNSDASDSESGSLSDEDGEHIPKQTMDRISAAAAANREKHKRKAEAESPRGVNGSKARKTDVAGSNKYGALQSISSRGGAAATPTKGKSEKACFVCGQPGHMRKDCPNR